MSQTYTLLDAISDDPFIGFCLVTAAIIGVWLFYVTVWHPLVWKPLRAWKSQRDIDAIKAELETVGHDVAEGKRRTIGSITNRPLTTSPTERLNRHG